MSVPSQESSSLLDWATRLATDPDLRTRLAEDPRAVLDEQGLADLPPVDLHHSLPLVTDSVAARLGTEVDATALGATAPRLAGEGLVAALARQFVAATDTVVAADPPPGPDDTAVPDDTDTDLDDPDQDTDHDLDDLGGDADAASPHPLPLDHTAQEATTMTSPTSAPGAAGDQHADLVARLDAVFAGMEQHGIHRPATAEEWLAAEGPDTVSRFLASYQPGDRTGDELRDYFNATADAAEVADIPASPEVADTAPPTSASDDSDRFSTPEEFATDPDTQAANRQMFLDQKAAFNHFPNADALLADARMADDPFLTTYSDYDARNDYSVERYAEHRVSHETRLADDPDHTDAAGASTPAADPLRVGDTDLDDLDGTGGAGTVQADDPTASGSGQSVTVDGSTGEGAAIPGWMSWDESTHRWVDNGDRSDIVGGVATPTDAPGTPQGWHTLTLEAQSQGFPDAQSYLEGVSREDMAGLAWEPGNRNAAHGELQAYLDAADAAGMSPADFGAANTYTPEQIDAAYAADDGLGVDQDTDLDDFGATTDAPADSAGEGAATPSWMSWDESQGLWVDNGSPDPGATTDGPVQTDTDLDGFGDAAPADTSVPHGDDPFSDSFPAGGQGTGLPGGDTDLDGFGSGSDGGDSAFGAPGGGGESFGGGTGDADASNDVDFGASTDHGSSDLDSSDVPGSPDDGGDDPGSGHTDFADHAGSFHDDAGSSDHADSADDDGSDDAGGDDGGSDDGGGESF